ncbi:MAG: helix-turn-helix transcriptional regulator [Coriobacteriales bacterium]|nr:helix-turn-helix transcriptional regulator [Coriobacteriales bacterium]
MKLLNGLHLRWETLAFAAYFATFPIYSPNLMFDQALAGFTEAMPCFANAVLLSAGLAGLAAAAWSLVRPGFGAVSFPLVVAGAVLSSVGILGFLPMLLSATVVVPLAILAGALSGIGTVILGMAWASYFARFDLKSALFTLGLLCGASALVNVGTFFLPDIPHMLVFAALSVVGAVAPVCGVWRASRGVGGPAADAHSGVPTTALVPPRYTGRPSPDAHPSRSVIGRLAATLHDMLQVVVGPFIGLLLFALTMAVRKVMWFEVFTAESLGVLLSIVVLLPLCLLRLEKPLLPLIYQVFLPILAALLILLNSFPEPSLPHGLGTAGIYVFFGIIGLLSLAAFVAAANAGEFPVPLIFGSAIAAFCVVSLVGLRLGSIPVISDNFEAVLLVLSTLYFLLLVLWPGLRAWRMMFTPSEDASAHTLYENLESRCEELSTQGALSRRESEIMLYIGRGYSPAYIAKKLFLSDSTVRSHVKNIYRKLGVHSRQDLLQLIDDDT